MFTRLQRTKLGIQCAAPVFSRIPCTLKKLNVLFALFPMMFRGCLFSNAQAADFDGLSEQPFSGLADHSQHTASLGQRARDGFSSDSTEASTAAEGPAEVEFPGLLNRSDFLTGVIELTKGITETAQFQMRKINDATRLVGTEVLDRLTSKLNEQNQTLHTDLSEKFNAIQESNRILHMEILEELKIIKTRLTAVETSVNRLNCERSTANNCDRTATQACRKCGVTQSNSMIVSFESERER